MHVWITDLSGNMLPVLFEGLNTVKMMFNEEDALLDIEDNNLVQIYDYDITHQTCQYIIHILTSYPHSI